MKNELNIKPLDFFSYWGQPSLNSLNATYSPKYKIDWCSLETAKQNPS